MFEIAGMPDESLRDYLRDMALDVLDRLPYIVHTVSAPDYRMLFMNQAAVEFLRAHGVDLPGSYVGKYPWELFPNWRKAFLTIYDDTRRTGNVERVRDVEYVTGEETTYWDATFVPNKDESGNVVSITSIRINVTERHLAEDAVRRSEENLRAIFDSAPAAIFTLSRDAVVLKANPACKQIYGFSPEQLLGRPVYETLGQPEHRERTLEVLARVFAGESVYNMEWNDRRADGSAVYVQTSATPLYDAKGRVIAALSLNMDITERKLAEERVKEMGRQKRDFYRRTIEAATEGKLSIAEADEIARVAGPPTQSWEIKKPADVGIARKAAAGLARERGMEESQIDSLMHAVGEATTNAVKHAGGGTASLHAKPDGIVFVISDRGKGIDALALPEVALRRRYSTAVSLGMGYKLMISLADKVYLETGPDGTTVALIVKNHPQPTLPAAAILAEAAYL